MNTKFAIAAIVFMATTLSSVPRACLAAGSFAEYDDIIAARVARAKIRQAMYSDAKGESAKSDDTVVLRAQTAFAPQAGCGNVNIGNVANNQRFGGIRNLTVIIDGPIVNTDNRCR